MSKRTSLNKWSWNETRDPTYFPTACEARQIDRRARCSTQSVSDTQERLRSSSGDLHNVELASSSSPESEDSRSTDSSCNERDVERTNDNATHGGPSTIVFGANDHADATTLLEKAETNSLPTGSITRSSASPVGILGIQQSRSAAPLPLVANLQTGAQRRPAEIPSHTFRSESTLPAKIPNPENNRVARVDAKDSNTTQIAESAGSHPSTATPGAGANKRRKMSGTPDIPSNHQRTTACNACKKSHSRCDRELPCESCIKNPSRKCSYGGPFRGGRSPTRKILPLMGCGVGSVVQTGQTEIPETSIRGALQGLPDAGISLSAAEYSGSAKQVEVSRPTQESPARSPHDLLPPTGCEPPVAPSSTESRNIEVANRYGGPSQGRVTGTSSDPATEATARPPEPVDMVEIELDAGQEDVIYAAFKICDSVEAFFACVDELVDPDIRAEHPGEEIKVVRVHCLKLDPAKALKIHRQHMISAMSTMKHLNKKLKAEVGSDDPGFKFKIEWPKSD